MVAGLCLCWHASLSCSFWPIQLYRSICPMNAMFTTVPPIFFFFFFLIYFEDLALNGRSICSEQHSINTAMDFAVGAFEGRKAFSHQGLLRWNMRCVCCVGQRPLLSYSGDRTMQKNERIMQQTTGIVFQRALKKQRVLALKLWYLYPPSTPRCLFFFVENHAVHNKRATCQESQATLPSGVVEQCKK